MAEPNTIKSDFKKRIKSGNLQDQNILEHGKLPPQAVDLEEAVLGAMMLEKNALAAVIDLLKPESFYKDAHQRIFRAIINLFTKSEPVDILTVTNELRISGELEIVGGPYYISSLTNRVASAANIEYHARIIGQKYIQRELIRTSTDTIKDAYEDSTDVFDLLDKAENDLFNIAEANIRRGSMDMRSLIREAIQNIEAAGKNEDHISGVPSGFTKLDSITAGWQKSDLIIIAARPGMGKTAFVLSMAKNIAADFKKPVAFFSLEMSAVQLVTRLISSETEIMAEKLRKGQLDAEEWSYLNSRINNLTEANLYIDDTPALTVFELRAKCRRLVQQKNIELVIIDYLQLMASSDKQGNREQEISYISRSLKSLAKELNIPVIALSQLSRMTETRGGSKRPQLSDLRESGAIEQDADMVLFIYRPEYYKITEDEKGNSTLGTGDLIIAKHRNGKLDDVRLRFIDKIAMFTDDIEFDEYRDSDSSFIMPSKNFDNIPTTITLQSKMNNENTNESPF
ncbi:MAG: replicative DNA helicase [Bacteroidota bacterium]|nr:replicative DNA helicase [Bacteroidota bacterium]